MYTRKYWNATLDEREMAQARADEDQVPAVGITEGETGGAVVSGQLCHTWTDEVDGGLRRGLGAGAPGPGAAS